MADHSGRRLAGWILLALAGLALAVALSVTASNLSRQPIGLSGEPLRAGERLAPATAPRTRTVTAPRKATKRASPKRANTPTTTATTTTRTVTQPAPTTTSNSGSGSGDDHGGSSHGSGGHGSDD